MEKEKKQQQNNVEWVGVNTPQGYKNVTDKSHCKKNKIKIKLVTNRVFIDSVTHSLTLSGLLEQMLTSHNQTRCEKTNRKT